MSTYRIADLFAGIGGTRLGFDRAFRNEAETVYVCELDPNARKTYFANFDADGAVVDSDITKVDERNVPDFDICLAGFPCQAFSLAGQRGGFEDNYRGVCRGTLFLDVVRICEHVKPKIIFGENTKGLLKHDKGRTFKIICAAFRQIGYNVKYKVLNSKDFGLAQNRDLLYIVCFRKDIDEKNFSFPEPTLEKAVISGIIESAPIPSKYYLSEGLLETLRDHRKRFEDKRGGFGYEIISMDGIANALVCGGMGREKNLLIDHRPHSKVPTRKINGRINDEDIRRLTPRECARLQGFPDEFKLPVADTHLYKQFGNTVPINVVERIAREIKKILDREEKSALHTLIKLLASNGKVYPGDEHLNRLSDSFLELKKVMLQPNESLKLEYSFEKNSAIGVYVNGSFVRSVEKSELTVADDDALTEKLCCQSIENIAGDVIKAKLQLYDPSSDFEFNLGHTIRTDSINPPTLLNASRATNFIFSIEGMTDEAMAAVNAIDTRNKIRDRLSRLGALNFVSVANENFHGSLNLVGETVEKILAEMLKIYYLERVSGCAELVTLLEERDPFDFDYPDYYRYKIKKFLCAVALGLNPSKQWNGLDEANGGYIIVKEDGDVIAYHLYDRNNFETYLLNNTRFETASTTKHDFASVCSREGEYYINLNLQIRFK